MNTYRLPYHAVTVDRGPMSKVAKTGLATEHDVMRTMYGESAVQPATLNEHMVGTYLDTTPADEHARLERMFGHDSESGQSWVERTYGPPRSGGLEAVMKREHDPDLAGPKPGGEAPDPMDRNAKQTPPAIEADDGGAQAALENETLPTGKDALRAELEALGCTFKVRDKVDRLEAMLKAAREIMALGGGIAAGSDLESLTEQLAQARAAAESGGENDAQAALEADVAQNAA